jgi:trk system potassium uptake protein TrkH
MFLFGVNFNIYFLMIVMKDFKSALRSEELKVYILMYISAVLFVLLNTYNMFNNMREALVNSAFHISSFMTSTGYSIGDVNIYPAACRIVILILMLVSACAGSTCGGFKISRLMISFKTIKRDLLKVFHPNSVHIITLEGKKVEEETVNATTTFLSLYIFFIILIMILVSFDGFSFEVVLNSVFTTFGNVGLAFEVGSFSIFSDFSTFVMTIGMLLGRLEIFPLIGLISSIKK